MFLAAVFLLLLGYVLLKLFQLWRADGDLTVMGSSMKPEYYKDRVVWVTGASSGSKLLPYTLDFTNLGVTLAQKCPNMTKWYGFFWRQLNLARARPF